MAVAAPIFLKVEKGPAVAEIRAGPASTAATKSGPAQMPASPKDREWLLLAAMAGETHDRFCLDAVVSCAEEVAPTIVASMICVGGDLDNMAVAPRTGFNAADYEVLVRNAAGKSLARLRRRSE